MSIIFQAKPTIVMSFDLDSDLDSGTQNFGNFVAKDEVGGQSCLIVFTKVLILVKADHIKTNSLNSLA